VLHDQEAVVVLLQDGHELEGDCLGSLAEGRDLTKIRL
jgi:hypothetical protein